MKLDLEDIRNQLHGPPVTRFAPSPTGYLHLGHVASAIFVWGIGRALGAKIWLRIEDHDRGRSRPHFEEAILEDLAWLGFDHDECPGHRSSALTFSRQSDREEHYRNGVETLSRQSRVYLCHCTRKEIKKAMADLGLSSKDELWYSGRCRSAGPDRHREGVGMRVHLPDEEVTFWDGLLGQQVQNPARQCGDLLIKDRSGHWTYQYAVAVDDLDQSVNLVIRGQDLLSSTGRQIMLGRWLGRDSDPVFLHHPLLTDHGGRKLGKRFFSEAVAKRRECGESPMRILGEAAWFSGLTNEPTDLDPDELMALFLDGGT